ncbi:MAG: hypothetical protein H6508_01990 [Calditrichaeota bacterium]|nr:hypothetical protein [Calditrichota bacterium]
MRVLIPFLLIGMLLTWGCGKNDHSAKKTAAQEKPASDPAAFVTHSFLNEQTAKREDLRRQLDSLQAAPVVNRKQVTLLINRRKGELMSLKKNLRNSSVLSPSQMDSLIAPLEEESIELAGDLIAVAN